MKDSEAEEVYETELKGLKKLLKKVADLEKEVNMLKSGVGEKGEELDKEKYKMLIAEYRKFKTTNVEHFRFNAGENVFGESLFGFSFSGGNIPHSTLQLVQIFFDTATFDDIERDKKIKTEAQLSLIGGTMGLLTGFSIISGIEIIFFLFRLISS